MRVSQRGCILVQATKVDKAPLPGKTVKNCQERKSSCMHSLSRISTDGQTEVWEVEDGYMYMKTHDGTKTTASSPRDFS